MFFMNTNANGLRLLILLAAVTGCRGEGDTPATAAAPDVMKRPGLIADRIAHRITLSARPTGLAPSGNPPEFLLVGPNSGHDYEAVAVSQAQAGDVHDALVFIGMPEGRPYSTDKLQLWPKGERANIKFRWSVDGKAAREMSVCRLLRDNRTGQPPPDAGWVFVSARARDREEKEKRTVCMADVYEPNSIISTYNEPATVFDLPRMAPQGAEYGHILLNPEMLIPTNAALEVVIEPEHTDGFRRVVDMKLGVKPGGGDTSLFDLRGGPVNLNGAAINKALEAFSALNDAGHDPFVTVSFDAGLTIRQAQVVCGVLNAIETEKGIRVEPPPAGEVFYRAFLPDEKNREREQRLAQPWELRFEQAGDGLRTTLVQIKESWREESTKPDLVVEKIPTPAPEDLKRELATRGPGMRVILVFAPGDMRYGELVRFLGPVLDEYQTIFVFVEK
jgi:hypothetical protein